MLRHLCLLADGEWFLLDGYDLLYILDTIVQQAFAKRVKPPGEGSGTLAAPFRMNQPSEWRAVGSRTCGPNPYFYRIGGRIIHKAEDNYTSDRGLVTGFDDDEDQTPKTSGAFGKDTGPSYKEYMNYITILNEEIQPHRMLAELCFRLLRDEPPPLPPRIPTDRARAWQVLPVLTATMFISETIRNNRAFATNLMLLELIATGATYGLKDKQYSLAKAVWNPGDHAGGHDDDTPLATPKVDVYGTVIASKVSELHLVGGKGAMTQKFAVDQSKPVLANIAKAPARPILTYAQQKEVSLLIHWLNAQSGPWVPRNAAVERAGLMPPHPTLPFDAVTSASRNKVSDKLKPMEAAKTLTSSQRGRLADIVTDIKARIVRRIDAF